MADQDNRALLDMTVGIVANFVANNSAPPADVAALIASTYAALAAAGQETDMISAEPVDKPSASKIRRSVSEKGIVSFLDGRTYQSLKRHLGTQGHTPESYRAKFDLPGDYPMVSPAYAARRSELAKAIGLGQGGRKPKTSAAKPQTAARRRKPQTET